MRRAIKGDRNAQAKLLNHYDSYIENFHESIKSILNEEIKEEIQRYEIVISELTTAINALETEVKECSSIQSLTKSVLLQLTSLQKTKEELLRQNQLYEKYKTVKDSLADLKKHISNIKQSYLDELQNQINIKMESLNDYIYNGQNKAPYIKLSDSSYTFTTPDDTGKGTSYKSMIVFDLAILMLTPLPVLIHDSYLLKQIQDTAIEKILELYIQSEKQIFIPFLRKALVALGVTLLKQ